MIKNIIFVLLGTLGLGIVGGVEHGEPLLNLLWLIPFGVAMLITLANIAHDL